MASEQELTNARNERFLRLLEPVYRDCQRWAYNLTQDAIEAEDLLAQSILLGLQNVRQLKNDGAFKAWMFRIIANAFKHHLRSKKRQAEAVDPEMLPRFGPRDDRWTERAEQADAVRRVLMQLAPEQRQALMLFEVQGFSIRETSEVLSKKEGAVRVLLHRARERLAVLLKKEGIVVPPGGE